MNSNTTILLVAAAFTMIGFTLGRVTGPKPPMAAGHFEVLKHMSEGDITALGGSGEVQVIVKSLEEGDFESVSMARRRRARGGFAVLLL